jgi:hypothetical protein
MIINVSSFIKALRGKYSQGYVNLKMGFSSNIVAKWERDDTKMTWKDFVAFCSILKLPLERIISSTFHYQGEIDNQTSFLNFLQGSQSFTDLSAITGISTNKLSRLFKSKSPLFLVDFINIAFLDDHGGQLAFARMLIPQSSPPIISDIDKNRLNLTDIIYESPVAALVYLSVDIERYYRGNEDKFKILKEMTGLEENRLNEIIELLIESNLLCYREGCLVQSKRLNSVSDILDEQKALKVRKFWTDKACLAIEKHTSQNMGESKDVFNSLVFTITSEGHEEVLEKYHHFLKDVRRIIINKPDKNKSGMIQVLNLQLFDPLLP